MINSHLSLFFSQSRINLKTVQVEVTIGDIERIGAIFLGVPNFLHTQNKLVKSREATIVVGTIAICFIAGIAYSLVELRNFWGYLWVVTQQTFTFVRSGLMYSSDTKFVKGIAFGGRFDYLELLSNTDLRNNTHHNLTNSRVAFGNSTICTTDPAKSDGYQRLRALTIRREIKMHRYSCVNFSCPDP